MDTWNTDERIKLLLVISNLEYGGAQRQVVELANHLDHARLNVHVCSLSRYVPLANALKDPERRLHVINKAFKFDLTVVPRLARLLRSVGADVIHSYLFDAEIAARLAGRLAGTRVIVGSERNTDYTLKRRQLIAYRLTRNCVDVIVANSRAGADFNSRMLGHDPRLYRVVHNGVDTKRFCTGDGGAVRCELDIRPDEQVVGMFASFKQQKNQPLFLAAAKRVLGRFPKTRLLLVGEELYQGMHGSDEYRHGVYRLIDDLGLRERCVLPGNRDDVERLYRACDVTVLPSLFEGTPNVALESMACGVPVVATDVSDNSYIIPHGRVGYVVPPGDEDALAERICRLLENTAERLEMGQRAREWVAKEFSITRLAERTAEVYETALADKCGDKTAPDSQIRRQAVE